MIFETKNVAGVPIAISEMDEAITQLLSHVQSDRGPLAIRFVNSYSIALANSDTRYMDVLRSPAGINLPDGFPVVWIMRRLGYMSAGRVRGPSFFGNALSAGRTQGLSHYFLGTNEATLQSLIRNIDAQYPGAVIAGMHAPAYAPISDQAIREWAELIRASNAQIVWVALGTPRQDFVCEQLTGLVGIPSLGVGAAFDFMAGTTREAPAWVQRIGAEWAFRLISEPRRLWRRYLFGNFNFLKLVSRQIWRERRQIGERKAT